MRSLIAMGFVFMICGVLTPSSGWSDSGPEAVKWQAHSDSDFDDGRRFLTDGSLLLESRYVPAEPVPETNVPPQNIQRLLQSSTDREFGLADLARKDFGSHYMSPGPIQLNRKYIDLLLKSPLKASLRFRAKGPSDPVLILDGGKIVGVMMPMKL